MARLPLPGSDSGTWGQILNDFLSQAHRTDGSLKPGVVTTDTIADTAISESKLDVIVQSKLNSGSGTLGATGPIGPTGPMGPTGATGPAGATGAAGTNGTTWTQGTGAPSGGVDGDFYFRTTTYDVYQRTASTWTIVANIQGPTGATGSAGSPGATGPAGIIDPSEKAKLTGVVVESGGVYPARPSEYANVKFIGVTDPGASALNGDEWVQL